MSLTPERVADIMNSYYAHDIPPVKALCEDWLALRKRAEDAEAKLAGVKKEWRIVWPDWRGIEFRKQYSEDAARTEADRMLNRGLNVTIESRLVSDWDVITSPDSPQCSSEPPDPPTGP